MFTAECEFQQPFYLVAGSVSNNFPNRDVTGLDYLMKRNKLVCIVPRSNSIPVYIGIVQSCQLGNCQISLHLDCTSMFVLCHVDDKSSLNNEISLV